MKMIFTRRPTQNGRQGSPARSMRAIFMAFLPEVARATDYKSPLVPCACALLPVLPVLLTRIIHQPGYSGSANVA